MLEAGRKVRVIYQQGSKAAARIEALAGDSLLERLSDGLTGELGGKIGIAPRLFLKKLVADILDRIELHQDFDPTHDYHLTLRREEMNAEEQNLTAAGSVNDIPLDV
jgi:hypothetical protein